MGGKTPLKKIEDQQHPVEVVGRLRQHPCNPPYLGNGNVTSVQVAGSNGVVRVRGDSGHVRDFSLDGVSWGGEPLHQFYGKYIQGRVDGVRGGGKCTIIMYGATGSGKSYTMFGSLREQGVAYRALGDIMEDGGEAAVKVIEIYNEDVYDLLAANEAKAPSASPQRVKLAVRSRKVKNASSINGKKAEDIARELQLVERRRAIKSTTCNERSSRSHCMIIVDVPSVGGRLVMVDMAGSENLDQAGICVEAKMQTGKINQGNGALKRVVESIANGDSHIPFRDSKLTMLLQDSFEDDKSRILMILCASTDPRDIHKTISTLEYGAKAKCIVKLPKSPPKDKTGVADQMIMEARINVLNAMIAKLQADNKLKDECREEMEMELKAKTEELENLKNKVTSVEGEKLQLIVNMLRAGEKLERLMEKLEMNRNKILESEYQKHSEIQKNKSTIDELILTVQGIEANLESSLESNREEATVESSLSHYLSSPNHESCLDQTDKSIADKEADLSFVSITKDEKVMPFCGLDLQNASKAPNIKIDAINPGVSSIANEDKSYENTSVDISASNTNFCNDNNESEDTNCCNDNVETEIIVDGKAESKMNSLGDWDEEIHFTVVSNDSEHQAVICKSCDTIEDFSESDHDVPEPAAHVCTSAELGISKGKSQNADIEEGINFCESKPAAHVCTSAELGISKGKGQNADIEEGVNFVQASCSISGNEKDDLYLKVTIDDNSGSSNCGGSEMAMDYMSASSLQMQKPGVCDSLLMDWTSGMSFRGWLPVIPEGSFEGEDSESSIHESREAAGTPDENVTEQNELKISTCETDTKHSLEGNLQSIDSSMAKKSQRDKDTVLQNCPVEFVSVGEAQENSEHSKCGDIAASEPECHGLDSQKVLTPEKDTEKGHVDEHVQGLGRQKENRYACDDHDPSLSEEFEDHFIDCFSSAGEIDCNSFEQNASVFDAVHMSQESQNSEETVLKDSENFVTKRINEEEHCVQDLGQDNYHKDEWQEMETYSQSEKENTVFDISEVYSSPSSGCFSTVLNEADDSKARGRGKTSFNLPRKVSEREVSSRLMDGEDEIFLTPEKPLQTGRKIWLNDFISPIVSSSQKQSAESQKSVQGDENDPPSVTRVSESTSNGYNVDVYVKWGNSTEELGKLVCIVHISKSASLTQLRKAITPHVPYVNKHFSFILLGETGGGEVGREIEGGIRVGSLPDCLGRRGCRLACLRPPRRIKLSVPPDRQTTPLSQIENQMPHDAQPTNKRKALKSGSTSATARNMTKPYQKKEKLTFKDKARAIYCKDLASNFLHGM